MLLASSNEIMRVFLFNFVKIILLKNNNCVLTLRKRLFCTVKAAVLQCKTAAFGIPNNRFYNTLMHSDLYNSYVCEKCLHSIASFRS